MPAAAQVAWGQIPVAGPQPTEKGPMVYDAARDRIVMFGGGLAIFTSSNTWEFDGSVWVLRQPATVPPARRQAALAYDSARQRVVMHGGFGATVLDDTWEWDGQNWTERFPPTTPAPLSHDPRMAYDQTRERMVMFASDTWEYRATNQAAHSTYGAGCAGSHGVPALDAVAGQRPWAGELFTSQLTNLRPGTATWAVIGSSRTLWQSVPLPLSLSVVGLDPSCELNTDPLLFRPVANAGGTATWSTWIPTAAAFLGGAFYQQGLCLDPTAPGGAVVSNGTEAEIGSK